MNREKLDRLRSTRGRLRRLGEAAAPALAHGLRTAGIVSTAVAVTLVGWLALTSEAAWRLVTRLRRGRG